MKGLFQPQAIEDYATSHSISRDTFPASISPITDTSKAVIPSVYFEANTGTKEEIRRAKIYPKTPCPSGTEHRTPINSTPLSNDRIEGELNSSPPCQPCALEFGDCVIDTTCNSQVGSVSSLKKVKGHACRKVESSKSNHGEL